jgi:hypothetical protein
MKKQTNNRYRCALCYNANEAAKLIRKGATPDSNMQVSEGSDGKKRYKKIQDILQTHKQHMELVKSITGFWKALRENVQHKVGLIYDDFCTIHENNLSKVGICY